MFLHKGYTARATLFSETEKHGRIRSLLPARGKLLSPTGQMHAPLNVPVTTSGRALVLVTGAWQASLANWPDARTAQRAGNNKDS
jgi:hypothetical protein